MKKYPVWMYGLIAIAIFSCKAVHDAPKYSFADDYYTSRIFGKHQSKVYVQNADDFIAVYLLSGADKSLSADTSKKVYLFLRPSPPAAATTSYNFRQASFDVDFLTIPFKFRPPDKSLPSQFNTNLNGAVYLGYRNDVYHVWYNKNPVSGYKRQTTHYGFSFGLINGLGGTAINQWVTRSQITSEYDGVVWSRGVAGILGIDNFTIGLAVGWDDLINNHKKYWIYQNKPWVGLAFGLNIN